MAAAPFRQQRTAGGAEAHRAGQVDIHHLREGLQVVFGAPPDDPGGIDQDIETVQPAGQTVDRGGVGHIQLGGRDIAGGTPAPSAGGRPAAVTWQPASARAAAIAAPMPLVPPVTSA